VLEELLAYGEVRPTWLGLEIWEVTPSLSQRLEIEAGGLLVRRVHDDSPAQRAGVEAGDHLLAAEGEALEGLGAWRTLLSHHGPGDEFELTLRREGRDRKVRIELEALDRDRIRGLARARMGLVLGEPTAAERRRRMPGDVLVVREVVEGGPAHEIGLVPGDLVTRIDGARIRNLEEFTDRFARIWERRAVMLRVARRGNFYRVTLEMD
jgi:S1-C subfamily serine protease